MILTGDFFKVGDDIKTEQRVKLQNCFAQFQQYGALLKPLMGGMNGMAAQMGATPEMMHRHMNKVDETTTTNNTETSSSKVEEEKMKEKTTRTKYSSSSRSSTTKVEDANEKMKRERGKRRHERQRYKPTSKLWEMIDELEEVKSKAR